jgi:hypothetical protein
MIVIEIPKKINHSPYVFEDISLWMSIIKKKRHQRNTPNQIYFSLLVNFPVSFDIRKKAGENVHFPSARSWNAAEEKPKSD